MTLAIVGIIDHTKDSKLKIQMNSIAPNGCSFSPSECHVCSSLPPPTSMAVPDLGSQTL
jgi:hypothetical protein